MVKEICPKCNHKSLRYRSSFNSYRCDRCFAIFDNDKRYGGIDKENRMSFDGYGNLSYTETTHEDGIIVNKTIYILESGKTTLRGNHSKLRDKCPYPERLDCNYGIGYERCHKMKYTNEHWVCE